MTLAEAHAALDAAKSELAQAAREAEETYDEQGFLERDQALELGARLSGARAKIWHLQREIVKLAG